MNANRIAVTAAIALNLTFALAARAATNSWTDSSGRWETGANWSTGSGPSASDGADLITNAGNKTVTIDYATTTNQAGIHMAISNLTVSATGGATNTLFLNNAGTATWLQILNSLTVRNGGSLSIANSAVGVYGLSGGFFTIDGGAQMTSGKLTTTNINVVVGLNGSGSLTVDGGTWLAGTVIVASNSLSSGSLTVTGGTSTVIWLYAGYETGAQGTITVNGGQLAIDSDVIIGNSGSGNALIITNGGQVLANGYCDLGECVGCSNNTVLISGPGSVWSNTVYATGLYFDGGSANSLVISNGGQMGSDVAEGYQFAVYSDNSSVVVTGTNSVLSLHVRAQYADLELYGSADRLVIDNGGAVYSDGGDIGYDTAASSNNSVLVTGPGSVWDLRGLTVEPWGNSLVISNGGRVACGSGMSVESQAGVLVTGTNSQLSVHDGGGGDGLWVGYGESASSLVIDNGGGMYSEFGGVGYTTSASNNSVLVTDPGSVWTNWGNLYVGYSGAGNRLTVTNGGTVRATTAGYTNYVGYYSSSINNTVTISGNGALWQTRTLCVGYDGSANQLTVGTGGSVIATNVYVGFGASTNSIGNQIAVNGGALYATSALGNGLLDVRGGTLTFNGGTITVDRVLLTNGANSAIAFSRGTLTSGGTSVTNNQTFAIGDGSNAATFHLAGGSHLFANDLRIRANASLTGCGTISGGVVVDPGGTVSADCGSTLNFTTGTVTNNGSVVALNGTTINFYGPIVNNGLIDGTGGGVNFYSTLQNNGTITGFATNSWTDGNGKWETAVNWSLTNAPSTSDRVDLITNAGNNIVTIDATTTNTPSTLAINNLTVSAPSGFTNTLFLNNAGTVSPLQVLSILTLGTNGAMVVNNSAVQSAGTVTIGTASSSLTVTNGGSLVVSNASHTGSVVVNAGSLILGTAGFQADNLIVTNGGAVQHTQTYQVDNGSITVSGGAMQVDSNFVVATTANSTGSVLVANGTLVATNGTVGIGNNGTVNGGSGSGTMTVTNGTVEAASILLGSGVGGSGTLTVQNGGLVQILCGIKLNDDVVDGGAVQVIANSGANCSFEDTNLHNRIVGGYLRDGTLTVTNSGTVTAPEIVIGLTNGTGRLNLASGTITAVNNLFVGMNLSSTGLVSVTGGSLVISNGVIGIGNNGTVTGGSGYGQMTISNASVTAPGIVLGSVGGGTGRLFINAGAVVHIPPAPPGCLACGIKLNDGTQNDDSLVDSPGADMVAGQLRSGEFDMNGGVGNYRTAYVGYDNVGTFSMAGGNVTLSSNLLVGVTTTGTGVVTVTGGQLSMTSGVLGVGNDGTAGGTGGVAHVTVSSAGLVDAASVLVGDTNGCDCGLTVASGGYVRAHGGLRSNGIKTTTVNGGTLEVVDGPVQPFEDPILFDSIVVSYGADGKLVVSNGTVRTPGMIVGASTNNTGTLVLAGGSTSVLSNMTVGLVGCSATGIVTVASGGHLYVTNMSGKAVLEVRSGTITVGSGGYVLVDTLVVTSACARVVNTGGSLTYSKLVIDPNLSAVGDGIPNGWKTNYLLDPFDPNLANKDSDGTGMSNLQKYQAGFNPTNPAAYLHVISVAKVNTTNINVTYLGANGDNSYAGGPTTRTNVLEYATGPANGSYTNNFVNTVQTVILSGGSGTGSVQTVTDYSGATNVPSRFYRVRVPLP